MSYELARSAFAMSWRFSVPGMGNGLGVKVSGRTSWRKLLANGESAQCEVGCEGSRLSEKSVPKVQ